jgi:N-(5-amino-5-carboxypentanoyl)-L-cysteinyl-D-valine synthase
MDWISSMLTSQISATARDWRSYLQNIRADRCDLDVLLRDEWRHRIVIRDDLRDCGRIQEKSLSIEGHDYDELQGFIHSHPGTSLTAMALAACHRFLEAYGNGAQTVIGCITGGTGTNPNNKPGIQPSVVDHRCQGKLTNLEFVEAIERESRQEASVAVDDLLYQGLFDAVLVVSRDTSLLPALHPLPLAVGVCDDTVNACLRWTLAFAADLFEDRVMHGVLEIIREVLKELVAHPAKHIGEIELICAEQKRQLDQWNATEGEFPGEVRLDELFEEAVRRSPDHCAIVCGQNRLSYRELNQRCNQLAHWLLNPDRGIHPGEIVGLCLEKSYRNVIAALGLWKAGAAYVPLDPGFPLERVRFTLQDTKARRIISHGQLGARLREMLRGPLPDVEVIEIETALGAPELLLENPSLGLGSRTAAYITYTSGTTGVPKGVPKEHRSVVNSITDLSERYHMRAGGSENVALFAAFVFEPFMRQTLIALINSQTLTVVPDEITLDPLRLPPFLLEHGITYLNGTRSVLQHFDLRQCPALKRVLLVGEELTAAGLRALRKKFDGRIINEYAFTETAFVTAIKEYPPGDAERTDRSIGRPLRNVKCYVVSQDLKRVPIGAIGELYIGGTGVARGYLNRPDLTAERFLLNPFQTPAEQQSGANARIYKTGDLARMLPDGQLEFMGRSDFQLKLNGVRVEPGEIEARVLEYRGVRQCVVIPRGESVETGNWHLVGYYVLESGQTVSESELLAYLESRLIRVMVPARMIELERLPVNVNGKVDRRALPEVDLPSTQTTRADRHTSESRAGSAELVSQLQSAWSEVLGVPAAAISANDDFFRLGGQSITCLRLIMRIWHRLRIAVTVEDVYRAKTLGQLATFLAQQRPGNSASSLVVGGANPSESSIRLRANGLQQGLLYQSLKSGSVNDAYVMQSLYHYHCEIDPISMESAWLHAQRKYPSLRLRFAWAEEPVQCADTQPKPLLWRRVDLSGIEESAARETQIEELRRQDRREPYKLEQGQLFRVYLIKQRADLYTLLFSCHHIILDGWSMAALHDEVHRFYIRLLRHEPIEIQEDAAYLASQEYLSAHRQDHLTYWKEEIDRITERGDFAGLLNAQSRYKADLSSYDAVTEHKTRKLAISAVCTRRVKDWCSENRITLHSVLQFVWHKVLHAIGGASVTVVGTVVSGRNLPIDGIEESVGFYINTLPLIANHDGQSEQTIAVALAEIQESVNRMNSRSTVELGEIRTAGMKRRLFDTLLVLENYPRLLSDAEAQLHQDQLRFEKSYDSDKVDYPIAVVAREADSRLEVNLWYAGELFDDSAVETLLGAVETLFEQIAADFAKPVAELRYVCRADQEKLTAWNQTEAPFPDVRTLHAAFEIAAERWPEAVAIVCGNTSLTFRELNRRANQLAHLLLRQVELRPDDLIALVLDKSEWMITAILAVWKAGSAYVPIDPAYPDDRVFVMLEDTRAQLILTDVARVDRLNRLAEPVGCKALGIQGLPLENQPHHNPVTETVSTDLAYAIYTSGTTGRPKAVLVEHRGVVNLHSSLEKLFALRRDQGEEAILSFSNYVFDHFVEQMTDALLSGQKLVILDDNMRTDTAQLYAYMNRNGVTYLSGTPSVLSLYEYSTIPTLRRVDAIGEDFTTPVFNKIRATFPGLIINGYGPTEISITSHKRPYRPDEPRLNKSIGFPVANTSCYVVNARMRLVPVGGIGELYIGGVGVARGYLNREDLTNARFIPNPFRSPAEVAQSSNARLYRTGDLVRWLPNGEIEYLGRNDLQVKIRGQRVELGEIEAALSAHPDISRSIVIARDQGGTPESHATTQKYLVAFYLSERELPENDLVRWLRTKLPQALVPARILRIHEIPVTSSGKLDVSRLPATQFAPAAQVDYVAPSNPIETQLCQVLSRALGIPGETIGVRDDFFTVGGDSLRAIKLAQLITAGFALPFNVAMVFAHPTIESQAEYIGKNRRSLDAETDSPVGLARARAGAPPTSLAQERLLFIDDFVGGTAAYNIPFALALEAEIAAVQDKVPGALVALVRRHAALRTLLEAEHDSGLVQKILPEADAVAQLEVRRSRVRDRIELDRELIRDAGHVFQLNTELPFRARILEVAGDRAEVIISLVFHHTCFDGWSWGRFREELLALLAGEDPGNLPVLRASYADFAIWQRLWLSDARVVALRKYWQAALEGWESTSVPADYARPAQFDYLGREIVFNIDGRASEQLKALARATKISLFSVMLAAYYLLLKVYTGQSNLIVGTPAANRTQRDFDGVVGCFVNLLALRARVDSQTTLTDYLRVIGDLVVQAQLHEELPFEQVVKFLQVETDSSRHPIVQNTFSLLNQDAMASGWSGMRLYIPDDAGRTTTKFDLAVTVSENVRDLAVNFTYAVSLFDAATIEGMIATYQQILREFCRLASVADSTRLSAMVYVEPSELPVLLESAGQVTPAPAAQEGNVATLHAVFEAIVQRAPASIAIACSERHLTYAQLNERANQLAHFLLAGQELRPNDLVALVMDKSEWMIITMLAVWKAGAAYVPIEPSYPDERISFMLEDTQARIVLTDEAYLERLRGLTSTPGRVTLGVQRLSVENGSRINPETATSSEHFAYAIYTSGTTGRPKAVLVRHANVVSFLEAITERYFDGSATPEAVLFLAGYVFDFSIEQLALSILSGHKLIVPESSLVPDDEFYQRMNREGLSYISGTPTHVQQFDLSRFAGLRQVLVAGEAFQPHHFEKIRREYQGPLVNAYGTTETTVYNLAKRFDSDTPYCKDLGRPFRNTQFHVLDPDLRPLPVGAVGEAYIAGDCLSAGYLNRSQLNAERFVENPFQTELERLQGRNCILYRTGDLVRRRNSGAVEFLGRNDNQVKVRGIRIELGEIETVIAGFPGIRQCAVVARKDGGGGNGQRLAGYYVSESQIDEDALFAHLRSKLIPATIPGSLTRVPYGLPQTANGKLDHGALAQLDRLAAAAPWPCYTPLNRTESRLRQIWSDVLREGTVGVGDDFFQVGGDSITALHLVSRVRREFGRPVTVKQVFDFPTIRAFANNALQSPSDSVTASVVEPPAGNCPLLPIQEWFFRKPLVVRNHWNQYLTIRTPSLDIHRLEVALDELARHHDVFRLRYRAHGAGSSGSVVQFYDAMAGIPLHVLDVRELDQGAIQRQTDLWQSGFDLEQGPLACAAYLHGFGDGSARVWMSLHHLIVDAVSWRILSQDLEILYHGGRLGAPGCTFRQWVEAVRAYSASGTEVGFWEDVAQTVAAAAASSPLAATVDAASSHEFALTEQESELLLGQSKRVFDATSPDLMLTALGCALAKVTGQRSNFVTLESHGREALVGAPVVHDTVGWFTTLYPLAVIGDEDVEAAVAATKANRARVPLNGIGYGALRGTYGGSRAPLPEVSFNYLGRFPDPDATQAAADPSAAHWHLDAAACGSSKSRDDQNASDCLIDVTLRCVGKRLAARIDSRVSVSMTQRFTAEFKARLAELAALAATRLGNRVAHSRHLVAPYEEEFDPYFIVNEQADGPTLFIFPPGEGGGESYLSNIANGLPGIRLVLFNNVHLRTPMDSFESIAQYYLPHVLDLQPEGPYNFFGWSFGGILALEVSLRLLRAGESVANLLMVDSFCNTLQAQTDLGLSEDENSLDPINLRYQPAADTLRRLAAAAKIVLFKATQPVAMQLSAQSRQLFDYYARSATNNLDTWMPAGAFSVETLPQVDHFSWVRDPQVVGAMCSRVRSLVAGRTSQETTLAWLRQEPSRSPVSSV